jgi:hypothetical protein
MSLTPSAWHLRGTAFIACSCDWGCPCNFNAMPTKGFCEGGWSWHIATGAVDDVRLDGLNFSVFVKWPGAIHHGNGEGVILVDERATPEQRGAIEALVSGKFGGPWGILAWTWPTVHGPHAVGYEVTANGVRSSVKAGDCLKIDYTSIKNPVNGAEAFPRMILPQGLIVKEADLGASETFTLDKGISLDHSGQYGAVGPFEYKWP